jgi:hypothetical protein
MKVGIISYYHYDSFIKINQKIKKKKVETFYDSWQINMEELFKISKRKNIKLEKYDSKRHNDYHKLIFMDIPRISDLFEVLMCNLFKRKIDTILVVHETFLGRARYILRIPYLFNKVLINCEENIEKFMSYKVKSYAYPAIPSKEVIKKNKLNILNSKRKNKLAFIGTFKLALSNHGSYKYRYKLVRNLVKYENSFDLYGYGWDRVPIPFDIIGIAIVIRVSILKKLTKYLTKLFFEPIGSFPTVESKEETLKNYDFNLIIQPTISKFNSICEKIFDAMMSGSIPVYYGQKLSKEIPENTFIRIKKNSTAKEILSELSNINEQNKSEYRKNIYNFLKSNNADKYRYSTYANLLIETILS